MSRKHRKRSSTKTSPFGTPGRVSHDSSEFYASRMYDGLRPEREVRHIENPIPEEDLDRLYCKSSEAMDELPGDSVHLMVTSPPYNAREDYDENLDLPEYLGLLKRVWSETYRVLVPGGLASMLPTWGASRTSRCTAISSTRCWRPAS